VRQARALLGLVGLGVSILAFTYPFATSAAGSPAPTASPETLTVSTTGDGTGVVTSSPAGINCGATCSASFPYGTVVTLTATADHGSVWVAWTSGYCQGLGVTHCAFPMDAPETITVQFRKQTAPTPVRCHVPRLIGKKLGAARAALENANCFLGTVKRRPSAKRRGRVIGQSPAPGAIRVAGASVSVTVSNGSP
jgi:hypothetical protein